jgi:hypothetical protein
LPGQHRRLKGLGHPGVLLLVAQVCTKMAPGEARSAEQATAVNRSKALSELLR